MSKIILVFFLTLFLIVLYGDECPFGLTNDPYPEKCGRYVDENGNDICDLSETLSNDSFNCDSSVMETIVEMKDDVMAFNGDGTDENGKGNQHGKKRDESKEIRKNESANVNVEQTEKIDSTEAVVDESESVGLTDKKDLKVHFRNPKKSKPASKNFHDKYFLIIIIPLLVFFILISYFAKRKKIPINLHHINLWLNVFLLISFFIMAFTSIILILSEYNLIKLNSLFNLIFIRNFTGIIFIFASILHIYLKWQSYVSFFKCYTLKSQK